MKVASLESFFLNICNDPLFAMEGMDLQRGEDVLEKIEELASEFEKTFASGSFARRLFLMRYPLAHSVIPVAFLRSIIKGEHLRRSFLLRPTEGGARQMIGVWSESQMHLMRCIENFLKWHIQISAMVGSDAWSPVEDMHGYIVTIEEVTAQLQAIRKNAHLLLREILQKKAILNGKHLEQKTQNQVHMRELSFVQGRVEPKYAHLHEWELSHGIPFRHGKIIEKYGPLMYRLSHFDDKEMPHTFMVYVVQNNESGVMSLKVNAIDRYTFLKLGVSRKDAKVRSHAHLHEAGLRYWYQCATHLYTTRDQRYWADIATIVDLERRPELSRDQVSEQKSSLFDLLLGSCHEELSNFLQNVKDHFYHDTYSLRHVWSWTLMRTYPSLFYLTFNKSVWRLDEDINFSGSKKVPSKEMQYQRDPDVLPLLSENELGLIMRGGRIREEARRAAGYV